MTSWLHVANCRFLCLGCRNDEHELFSACYARSNKKRGSKLLRCFPHCCPDHVPRSYCGCSLHVLVTFESADEAAIAYENADVAVCVRFEAAAAVAVSGAGAVVTAMPTDAIVALPESVLETSGSSMLENDWVRAEKAGEIYQRQFPENTILYVLNNHRNPQWFYSYESGSTKPQREMKHALAAYVFLLHPTPGRPRHDRNHSDGRLITTRTPVARVATVVARQASPAFTMVSYRRQNEARRAGRKVGAKLAASAVAADESTEWLEEVAGGDVTMGETSPAEHVYALKTGVFALGAAALRDQGQTVYGIPSPDQAQYIVSRTSSAAKTKSPDAALFSLSHNAEPETSPSSPLGIPSPRPTLRCPICSGLSTLSSHAMHPATLEKLQPLLLLRLFLQFVPLDAFAFYFTPMDFRIQRRWLAKMSPSSRSLGVVADAAAYIFVADIASAFELKNFLAGPLQLATIVGVDPAREQIVLRSCADLILDAFSSLRVQQILMSSLEKSATNQQLDGEVRPPTAVESCEQFSQLVADLFDELTQLVAARYTNNSQFGDRCAVGCASGHVSILALVDDILSLVYAQPHYRSLRQDVSALLLRTDITLEVTVQTLFRAFMTQQHQTREMLQLQNDTSRRLSRLGVDESLRRPKRDRCVPWNRRWFLVPTSVFISPLASETNTVGSSPSLLFVVTFLRLFASVDVLVKGCQLDVKATMTETTTLQYPAVAGTVFQLDGQPHALSSLPNGMSAAGGVALFGDCWSLHQYEGRLADDGASLELTMIGLPSSTAIVQPLDMGSLSLSPTNTMETTYQVRLRVVLEDVGNGGDDCLSVFADVSSARFPAAQLLSQHEQLPTSSSDHMLDPTWCPIVEVNSTYIGLSKRTQPNVM